LDAIGDDIEKVAKDETQEWYKLVVEAFEAEDYETARTHFETCTKRYKEDHGAQYYLTLIDKIEQADGVKRITPSR
jgi:outer membrane protein assembly factor BamD (BamD/ComL family)